MTKREKNQRIVDLEEIREFNTAPKDVQELRERTLEMAYKFLDIRIRVNEDPAKASINQIIDAAKKLEDHITKRF